MIAAPFDPLAVTDVADPDRMAVIASLHGLAPAPPASATVLELGTSDGANVLTLAQRYPAARVLGLEREAARVEAAQDAAAVLGLSNAHFAAARFEAPLSKADYVIALGVSRVAPEERQSLFQAIARLLGRGGTALLSWDSMPGMAELEPVILLMRHHVANVADPAKALRQARDIAHWHVDRLVKQFGAERAAPLQRVFAEVRAYTDDELFDILRAPERHALLISELAAELAAAGLMWLANASMREPQSRMLPGSLRELARADADPVRRQQYLDFFLMPRRRTSLVCRADETPVHEALPESFLPFFLASRVAARHLEGVTRARVPSPIGEWTLSSEATVLLRRLAATTPAAQPVAALLEGRAADAGLRAVAELWQADVVEMSLAPPALAHEAPPYPATGALQRVQALGTRYAVSLWQRIWELDDDERKTLARLDGTTPRDELDGESLRKLIHKGFVLSDRARAS